MKERPILFKGPMTCAILDDLKTQTRRVIKDQDCVHGPCPDGSFYWIPAGMRGDPEPNYPRINLVDKCPQGKPGDRLWVKETWKPTRSPILEKKSFVRYRADNTRREIAHNVKCGGQDKERWRPSIFMFRWASRIDLEITEIRAQRIQDISAADCLAEGIDLPIPSGCNIARPPDDCSDWSDAKKDEWIEGQARATYFTRCADAQNHIDAFRDLWDSINSKPKPVMRKKKIIGYISYPWEGIRETREYRGLPWRVYGNPWVFATSFRRVKP